jgi:hypothetical protein
MSTLCQQTTSLLPGLLAAESPNRIRNAAGDLVRFRPPGGILRVRIPLAPPLSRGKPYSQVQLSAKFRLRTGRFGRASKSALLDSLRKKDGTYLGSEAIVKHLRAARRQSESGKSC